MSQGKALTEQECKCFFDLCEDPGNSYTVKQAANLAGFGERSGYYLLAERRRREAAGQEGAVTDRAAGAGKPNGAGRKPCAELDEAFRERAVPMLEKHPRTMAVTIVRILREKLGEDADWAKRKERSILRRVRAWKKANARKPVPFLPQHYGPGYEMQVDFTRMDGMGVTIRGKPFRHMLFGAYLPYSGMRYFEVVTGGESFDAVRRGMENTFHCIGGVPFRVHTDSLSAASRNTHWQTEKNLTRMAEAFCHHYGIVWRLSNPGRPNEKGGIERINGNFKDHLADRLKELLEERGSTDFESEEEYCRFVQKCLQWLNSRVDAQLRQEEAGALRKLPESRFEPFAETEGTANSCSFVRHRNGYYSVPPGCIGKKIVVRNFGHRTDLILDGTVVASHKPAKLGRNGLRCAVNPLHLIEALKKKPMGLRHLACLEQLFLNELHARTFDLAIAKLGDRKGCRLYVGLLSLAVEHDRAAEVDAIMTKCLATGDLPDISQVREQLQIPARRGTAAGHSETATVPAGADAEPDEKRSQPKPCDRSGGHPLFSYADALADENLRECLLIGLFFKETARNLDLRGQEGMRELADAAAVMLRNLMPPPGSEEPAAENPAAEAPADEPPPAEAEAGDGTGQKTLQAGRKAPATAKKAPAAKAGSHGAEPERRFPTGREVVDAHGKLRKQGKNHYAGPCPVCDGDDCFSVDVERNIIYCRKCEPNSHSAKGRQAFAKLMQALNFSTKGKNSGAGKKKAAPKPADENGRRAKEREKARRAAGFWKLCASAEGTRTEKRLGLRGITWKSDSIRHTDKALRSGRPGKHECMAVRFVNTLTNRGQAVQRTFWDEENPEERRLNIGVMSGAAAFIGGEWECEKWTVAEGTEDAASLAQCGIDGAVLATGGTEPMKKFRVPDHVTCVVVAADNDEPGRKAASVLRKRLEDKGVKVEVREPADGCKDWNEMLCEGLEDEIRKIMRS